jgi:NADH:ubiquinone oxidoreductase subunit K
MYSFKRFRFLLLLPIVVVIIGTIGMMAIEHLSFVDALYFTIVTIATVGYGDVTPVTTGGKVFSIFLIIVGIGSFVTLLTSIVEWFSRRRQYSLHQHRLNMLIGVFFTEVGNQLLHTFTSYDPNIDSVRRDFIVTAQWSEKDFMQLHTKLTNYHFTVVPSRLDLDMLYRYLKEKGDLLIRQLENVDLIENETYVQLLWAVVHLRDELAARPTFFNLPETDVAHIVIDVQRAYTLLVNQWLDYMLFLKNRYPFLFSLASRTNPFVEKPIATIT